MAIKKRWLQQASSNPKYNKKVNRAATKRFGRINEKARLTRRPAPGNATGKGR